MTRPAGTIALTCTFAFLMVACDGGVKSVGDDTVGPMFSETSAGAALTDFAAGAPEGADAPAPTQPTATPTSNGSLRFFTDRGAFRVEAPDLPLEDFEEGNVGAGGAVGCPSPLDETSNNFCFAPGDIVPGVRFSTPQFASIALLGTGFGGAPSKNVVANFFVDNWVIDFTAGNVTGAGMDLVAVFAADVCEIEIFGASGLLGSTAAPCTNAGTFWGVVSDDEVITQITITSPNNQPGLPFPSAEGVDNIEFGEAFIPVVIDIKPGSDPNSINPTNLGVIPVAILTTSAAAGDARDFDAADVDASTVAFGPGGAAEAHGMGHMKDVDGDGDMDMVLHFRTQQTGIACGDTEATLTGRTLAGRRIKGTDAVNTVGCKNTL